LDDLRIDRGIALGVPGANGAGRAGPKAGESVSAIVEQIPVPKESVPETRTLHVARVEYVRPVVAQEPVVTPLGVGDLGKAGEVELVRGRLDGSADP